MFGLTKLQHVADPETTLDKFLFLISNAISNSNRLTTIISFSALFVLITMKSLKERYKGTWWIYSLPEVFLVVVVSTSLFFYFDLTGRSQSLTIFFSSFRPAQVGETGRRYSWLR